MDAGAAPLVSVVVSTRQRAGSLAALISALERQTLSPDRFEVVVVDDASTDDTPAVLMRRAEATRLRVRTARLDAQSGPAAGRNAGWRLARADVIAFTDDDCRPAPAWLEHGLAAMNGADVVAGRTHPDPEQLDKLGPYCRTMWPDYAETFPTCNVLYRRADLEAAGGFDESFGKHGGEDTDLAWRVESLGRRMAVDGDLVVYHDVHRGSFGSAAADAWRWLTVPLVFGRSAELRRRHLFGGIFWKRHERVVLAAIGLALAPFTGISLALTAPWVFGHIGNRREIPRLRDRITSLPGAYVVDALQVVALLAGSVRYGRLVL